MSSDISAFYKKRRFAYLANENLRNFQCTQEITERFSRIAWAAVSYLAYAVFSGPSLGDMVNQSTFLVINHYCGTDGNKFQTNEIFCFLYHAGLCLVYKFCK